MKTVKVPYFEGDEVPLKFKAKGKNVELLSARVSVFSDKGEVLHDAPCQIEGDVVSFTIPSSATELASDYRADFTVYFSPDITRTHIIRFHIAQRVPSVPEASIAEMPIGSSDLMTLDETSSDYEADGAIAQVTRKLRRAGALVVEAARTARDLAENMTGRRI